MIKKGRINEQTRLTVAINVHLTVFLMGYLIKNLLVAAGLPSHPITAPPRQNLCHWPSPTPNTSLVSHMTSVSQGPVMECCAAAIPPQVLPAGRHPSATMPMLWLSDPSQAEEGGGGERS